MKTTSGPLKTPFFMSGAEVEYATACPHRYKIYRIYSYSVEAQEIKFVVIETYPNTRFYASNFSRPAKVAGGATILYAELL